jgi:putative ABC transport system substrate-binding protein
VDAQQPGKVARVGVLAPGFAQPPLAALRQGLRGLGYVEGQNLTLVERFAEGRYDRLSGLAAELVRLKVDVILSLSTPAALAAKNATDTIPIVMLGVGDPVKSGLVASLARPGGKITGLTFFAGDLSAKWLELLKQAVPRITRIAVLLNPANPAVNPANPDKALDLNATAVAARALRVQLQILEAPDPSELDRAFSTMAKERADALFVVADPMFFGQRSRIVDLAATHRLPTIFASRGFVEAGGLMAYAPNADEIYRRAAGYVDKILKGAKPADLPVEQPTRFELVVNLKTAKALGLTLPQSILIRADQVIQ